MSKVTVQSTFPDDYVSAPGFTPSSAAVTASQTFVKIDGSNVLVEGDAVASHDDLLNAAFHDSATMVATQTHVTIGGKKVIVDGDAATCTHLIVAATQSFVTIT